MDEQKTLMENQRCPVHPEIWMYFNMQETRGFCKKCGIWRNLADVEE